MKIEQKKKTLSERVHNCDNCGYRCDRDVAAAMVMLNYASGKCGFGVSPRVAIFQDRGTERASTDDDESTSTYCGSFKQVAQMKRQKRVAQS